jgi:uncharacterized membrane protein YfhO
MEIPAGKNEIVFEFKPEIYYKGETISLIGSLLSLLILLGAGFQYFRGQKQVPAKD